MTNKLFWIVIVIFLLAASITLGASTACCEKTKSGDSCVQTDASNCDSSGKVAGINNFKVGGGAEGLGFALESNSIKESVNKIADRIIIE